MSETNEEQRYLFTVRQRFGEIPAIDSFYQLQVPSGLTGEQAEIMRVLDPRFCKNQLSEDTAALQGMQMRLRFNSDIYQKVCLVRTNSKITADDLDSIIEMRHGEGKLIAFLDESAI